MITNINEYAKNDHCLFRQVVSLFSICLFTLLFTSCKKEVDPVEMASLTVVHAISGGGELKFNFKTEGHGNYRRSSFINYSANLKTVLEANKGPHRMRLFQMPDTTAKDAPLFDLQLNLPSGSMQTLFLAGTPDTPDSLMIRDEQFPFYPAGDSATGIRFLNLLQESTPVSINVKGESEGSVTANLGYKSVTAFRRYPVSRTLPDYVFEFRDVNTGTVLATFTTLGLNNPTPNLWIYRSITLVLTGTPGATDSLKPAVFSVHH